MNKGRDDRLDLNKEKDLDHLSVATGSNRAGSAASARNEKGYKSIAQELDDSLAVKGAPEWRAEANRASMATALD